jgi:hypothetical protein
MQFHESAIGRQLALFISVLCFLLTSTCSPSQAAPTGQSEIHLPPIGIIDFYGLRAISPAQAKQALQIKEGDAIPDTAEGFKKFQQDAQQRLEALPGVLEARLSFICCNADKTILYVGIAEKGSPVLSFLAAPQGKVRLPENIVKAGEDFQAAFMEAMQKRDFEEDDSQGYALNHYPAVHEVQERFITLASKNLSILRDVLHNSSDAGQRALAAQVIAYSADREVVAQDLAEAVHDPDGGVRNNATRALGVLAGYAQKHPELHITISAEPFVDMLNSLEWTDRNKASMVLVPLTETRDPTLLTLLRQHALPSLIEMARWKAQGHAFGACVILGRIASLQEDKITNQCWNDDREGVISAALKSSKTN